MDGGNGLLFGVLARILDGLTGCAVGFTTTPEKRRTTVMTDKPCDCIEKMDGYWTYACGCCNSGDLADAAVWCARANDPQLVNENYTNSQLLDCWIKLAALLGLPEGEPANVIVRRAADEIESLRAQVADFQQANHEIDAEVGRLKTQQVRLYNSGYHAGHEDTVEGGYTDVLPVDMDTYHDDIVADIVAELKALEGQQ